MPLVAKRKLTESWRDAVARRGRELAREEDCLTVFDALIETGAHEVEAAYRSLARLEALSHVPDAPWGNRREDI